MRGMEQSSLPSKKFIIRAGVAILIVVLIFIVQTSWFTSLFKKTKTPTVATVGEAIIKDSNGNGIPDWEESLWGLDPTVLYTGEMSNREIIENRKKALGISGNAEEGPINESETIARQLFSVAMSLGAEGASLEEIGQIGAAIGDDAPVYTVPKKYNYTDIKTAPTSVQSIQNYETAKKTIANKYQNDNSADIIISIIDYGDFSRIEELKEYSQMYKTIAEELRNTAVPVAFAQSHLDIMNAFNGMGEAFTYIAQSSDNMIIGMSGFGIYKNYSTLYEVATDEIAELLAEYGVY